MGTIEKGYRHYFPSRASLKRLCKFAEGNEVDVYPWGWQISIKAHQEPF
jgi:hypothetical protein